MSDERVGINWVQVAAAALAAVSSAVVLSTLGVAGTLIGAALGSVTASIGSSIFGRGIDLSKQQVASQAAALRRVTAARANLDEAHAAADAGDLSAQARLGTAENELDEAERVLSAAAGPEDAESEDAAPATVAEERIRRELGLSRLPWKRIAVLTAVVFIGAMGVITGFEVLTGRAVSTYTGGSSEGTRTTFSGVTKDVEGKSKPTQTPTGSPTGAATSGATDSSSPTDEPTDGSTSTEPTDTPSTSVTAEPTPTESVTPTEVPTGTPEVTPTEGTTPTEAPPTTD